MPYREIGEIFEHNGSRYRIEEFVYIEGSIENNRCDGCAGKDEPLVDGTGLGLCVVIGRCSTKDRFDGRQAIAVRLEDVSHETQRMELNGK
jgi:hypothetical protein